jgi:hypothetical protein
MKRHLKLLTAIREASDDPQKAYLVRSRLRRALIALNRGFYGDGGALTWPVDVQDSIRRIEQRAINLCQPSEALDVRWKQEWSALQDELERLEARLSAVPG